MKSFELLDHEADVGIKAWGKTAEEAFAHGAEAMFSVMVNLEHITVEREIDVEARAGDLEELFVEWLNELLAQRDLSEMVFSKFEVEIKDESGECVLTGKAKGEQLDHEKHETRTEVKAATYYGLRSGKENDLYYFQCVLDI
jgi:SHS2 domain-containing protein